MKKIRQILASIALVAIANSSFSQIKISILENQFDETMSSAALTARNHAVMIVNDTALKAVGKIKYADIVLKNLDIAKNAYKSIKSSMSATTKETTKNLDTTIEQNNTNAMLLATALKEELQKQKSDEVILSNYSEKIVASIDEMEKAHQALK